MYVGDDWPKIPDGSKYDGNELLALVRSGNSPFHGVWDVNLLIREIEDNLGAQLIDIPAIYYGSNNHVSSCCNLSNINLMLRLKLGGIQGFQVKMSNQSDIFARLARGDVNML